MARPRCALSIAALASLAACGEPQAPPSALGPRPSEALAAVHADATFVLHVDTAALRRSSFGPAASGALCAEIAKLAGLKYVPSCRETSTHDAFDDVVVSIRGANVHVGAYFAKGISESKKSACAYALSASADRRGDLVVSPPGLELDPKAAAAQAELRLEGPQIARAKGQLPGAGATVDARLDSDTSSTTLSATLTAPTEVRARELALALDGLFGGEVAQARASGALEEAHVTKGTSIALSVRFVGAPGQQTATAAAVARGFSSKGVSELGKESLPEVLQKLTGMADPLEKYGKENGKFPPSTAWVKRIGGVTVLLLFVAGVVFWGGFNWALEATNKESFCISCHEMEENVFREYQNTVHYTNRTGVRATCPDCHEPKEWGPKMIRKIQASNEVFHKILGTIDTPEKFNA